MIRSMTIAALLALTVITGCSGGGSTVAPGNSSATRSDNGSDPGTGGVSRNLGATGGGGN